MGDDSLFVVGFDILPAHSPRAKTQPKFACVTMHGSVLLNEYSEISRGELLRLVGELQPTYLATDNIFEMIPDSKALFGLIDRIPPETKIVQVTGVPPHQVPLKSLARRHGIEVRGKPTPLASATIAARLASIGVGYVMEYFSEQTEVKVTRGRVMGRGGQSVNRYRRKIHSEIQQMTRFIEDQLRAAEIDFEVDVRTSDYGYASARIVANAPLPAIRGFVESKRGGDFNVIVSPVRKRAEFLPLEARPVSADIRPGYFIVGVDPGTTAALCLLSLDGTVHRLESKKGLTRSDMVRFVYEHGVPVIVATDKTPVPHLPKKLAAALDIGLFVPNRPIPVSEKQDLARDFSQEIRIRNAHERDALTAAVYAYRDVLPKLEQIDRKIREEQIQVDKNHVKALVIKGMQVSEAIANLSRPEPEVPDFLEEPAKDEAVVPQESLECLREKVSVLAEQNKTLTEKAEDLERMVEYLKFRETELAHSLEIVSRANYWRVKRDREVAKKENELTDMRKEIENARRECARLNTRVELLRGVRRREMSGDMVAVKIVPHFTHESIEEYNRRVGLKANDVVFLEDASGGGVQTASLLVEREIRAVIISTPISHLAQEELVRAIIPVIDAAKVELQRIDEFAFISRNKFEVQLQEFMKEAREKARQQGEEELIGLIERYRREVSH